MKYRNISSGVIPIPGRGEIQPNKAIDLTDEESQLPEIAIYIGKYLSPIITDPVVTIRKKPEEVTKALKADAVIERSRESVLITAPPDKTEKELKEEKQKEEDKEIVSTRRAKKTKDGSVVQTIQEVTKGKIRWAREKLRDMKSWQQRIKYIETIDNVALLEALLPKLTGKVEEATKKRIKKLRRGR